MLSIDGKMIDSGDNASAFEKGAHILICGDKIYPVTVCVSAFIPTVYINTKSGNLNHIHANKENKEQGDIRVYANGKMALDSTLKQIKGRGNASWGGG